MSLPSLLPPFLLDAILDSGIVPESTIRQGIRRLLAERLRGEGARSAESRTLEAGLLRHGPIALEAAMANHQHYEVPSRFFELVLGPRLKYSSALWPPGVDTLAEAEVEMLVASAARAGVEDGQSILDLGCGWGSLSLWLAETFPAATITAVSNSRPQKDFIEARARAAGRTNLRVLTRDVNDIGEWRDLERRFDRILSVEMFEHARNYAALFAGCRRLLADRGRLFVHVFAHRRFHYLFADDGSTDWMARHFFTGGTMPSVELFESLCGPELDLVDSAWIDGRHYARTCEVWRANLDQRRDEVERALAQGTGRERAPARANRWRIFFLACAEMFAYAEGGEWGVSHQVFEPA